MANKVTYGFKNVYYAVITESQGTITYGNPVAMANEGAGAISVSLSASGDETTTYADDVVWFNQIANNGYEGDLVMTKVGDAFKKDVLGMTEDSNGALTENSQVTPKMFALGFEVQGNEKPTRTWYYYCQVARPSDDASTKEASVTPNERTLSLRVMPRPTDSKVKTSLTQSATNTTAYNNFFNAVYEPVTSI